MLYLSSKIAFFDRTKNRENGLCEKLKRTASSPAHFRPPAAVLGRYDK